MVVGVYMYLSPCVDVIWNENVSHESSISPSCDNEWHTLLGIASRRASLQGVVHSQLIYLYIYVVLYNQCQCTTFLSVCNGVQMMQGVTRTQVSYTYLNTSLHRFVTQEMLFMFEELLSVICMSHASALVCSHPHVKISTLHLQCSTRVWRPIAFYISVLMICLCCSDPSFQHMMAQHYQQVNLGDKCNCLGRAHSSLTFEAGLLIALTFIWPNMQAMVQEIIHVNKFLVAQAHLLGPGIEAVQSGQATTLAVKIEN